MSENSNGMGLNFKNFLGKNCFSLIFVAIFSLMFLRIIYSPYHINHDCASIIEVTQKILEGKRPYVDIDMLNPPLIFYITMIPVFIAKALSASQIVVFSLFILCLVIISTITIYHLLAKFLAEPGSTEAGIIALFYIFSSVFIWTTNDFGQREHLFILLFYPFFIMRWIRWEGGEVSTPLAIMTGIAAAIGLCIKPHFLLIALLPELYWWATKRNLRTFFRPEIYALTATGFTYAVHFFLLPSVIREAFLRSVRFTLKWYGVYNNAIINLFYFNVPFIFPFFSVRINLILLTVLAVGIIILVKPDKETRLWSLSWPLVLVILTSLLIYFMQHTGWSYHAIPTIHGVIFMAALIAAQSRLVVSKDTICDRGVLRFRLDRYQVCLLILFLSSVWAWNIVANGVQYPQTTPFTNVLAKYSQVNDQIMVISTSVGPAYPALLQMKRRLGSRFPCQLPIAFIQKIRKTDPALARREENRYLNELTEDIVNYRPRLIIIDNDGFNQALPLGFNILKYLTNKGFIKRSMRDYRQLTMIKGFTVFITK